MPDQISANGPVLLRRLGAALREARQRAKVTQEAVAKALRCSRANVSHLERGQQTPTGMQLDTFLVCIGASDELRSSVFELLKQVHEAPRAWWDDYEDLFPAHSFRFWALEDAASRILTTTGPSMPGLLQTPEYAAASAEFYYPDESAEYRRRFVQARMERFRVVERGTTQISLVLQEACLLAEVGGRDVLRRQIDRLIEAAERPAVSIRIVPNIAPMTAFSGTFFTVLEFPGDDPSVLFSSTTRDGVLHEGGKLVEDERRRFAVIEEAALSTDESLTLMKKMARA